MLNIYLHGNTRQGSDTLSLSLPSAAVIFVVRYCKLKNYRLFLADDKNSPESDADFIHIPECSISDCSFFLSLDSKDLPSDIASCKLPVVKGDSDNLIRCGLCSSARYIVLQADKVTPTEHLDQILGFRGGTLKSCAEVSSWTKLCEVGIPQAVHDVRVRLRNCDGLSEKFELPHELGRLEQYLCTPVLLHNDDKKKREVLSKLQKTYSEEMLRFLLDSDTSSEDIRLKIMKILQQDIAKEHCVTKFQILRRFDGISTVIPDKKKRKKKNNRSRIQRHLLLQKQVTDHQKTDVENIPQNITGTERDGVQTSLKVEAVKLKSINTTQNDHHRYMENGNPETSTIDDELNEVVCRAEELSVSEDTVLCRRSGPDQSDVLSHVVRFIRSLSPPDICLDHNYVEGMDLTLADLLLFVFIHFFMKCIHSFGYAVENSCPRVMKWYSHMSCLPRVMAAAKDCGIVVLSITSCSSQLQEMSCAFSPNNTMQDDGVLSHVTKGRCRALKPDVANAISKIEKEGIQPVTGQHPCTPDIQLPWSTFPKHVLPFEGSESRVRGKCEQLENLVSAVVKIAKPGHVIVDFCSGAGHLGIVIAYLLPDCQIYLIENKEESVMRAKHRVDTLCLNNVTLFQCNLDYFTGAFDIGVCLHGCGVATDMVLQKCLENRAAFVVCPCCYGKVQNTHSIIYPRSQIFRQAQLTAKEYIILGHAADQTEVGIELEKQGKYCSNLVDTDRGMLFRQYGYSVILCSLQPLTCTTKNNLLIGEPPVIEGGCSISMVTV